MALIDVVKCNVNNNEFVYKFPSDDLRMGSQLVVYTAQTAFFVKGGQICDEFKAGTYTISSENIPILNKILNVPFGTKSPFQAEVWFINQIAKLDLKWGTFQPIQIEDPKYGIIVPVRAFGQYGVKIINPRLFLESLIGNMTSFTSENIDQYFKGKLVSHLSELVATKITNESISILDINTHLLDMSLFVERQLNDVFQKYGIGLVDFSIMSINVPQDDPSIIKLKEAKATAARLRVTGRDLYQMERSFDVLEKAAGNTGAGGQMMAMGAGIGAGMGMGNAFGNMTANTINTNPVVPPPIPQAITYYLYINGQQYANQTYQQIESLFAQGVIDANTLVWKVGMENWLPLSQIQELVTIMNKQTPPTIPPQIS
ncbi:MAG: SPFH domain-containing protein [Paludibacteraceae bacterium]|nr:SPFH domain-containing protein [Paludibacteraceae bacterium]